MKHTLSQAYNPQGLALDLYSNKPAPFPSAVLQARTTIWNIPRNSQQQSNCMFRSSTYVARRRIDNDDTQLGSRFNIYTVLAWIQ